MPPRLNRRLRNIHATLAPVIVLPLLLTLTTGVVFQLAMASGNTQAFLWVLEVHRGHFGPLNLEMIYPFLNALGLLTLIVTGTVLWWQRPSRPWVQR